ncbi:hypothetical protein ACIBL3_44025 [Kribbella sp. NPDC050124]|uniref:hypothetical protein n=1 Tax=Kribbella sp. NPDC050124 TaxID=3364114 RepID=UPI0037ACB20B
MDLVGLAAIPSAALWARLGRTWSRPALLLIVGPLAVSPLIHNGYHQALLLSAGVVAAAAVTAAAIPTRRFS